VNRNLLFQAAAQLLPTASWLLLQVLFIEVHWEELSYPPTPAGFLYLEFSWAPVPPLESYKPAKVAGFVFSVRTGNCPSPVFWWSILDVSHCCNLCSYKVHWGELPNPPSLATFVCLEFMQGTAFPPLWQSVPLSLVYPKLTRGSC
jgi:hypothetical protein